QRPRSLPSASQRLARPGRPRARGGSRGPSTPAPPRRTAGVAEQRERQPQRAAERFRTGGALHRDADPPGDVRRNLGVRVAIFRQLAETEWSPVTAVEDHHLATVAHQLAERAFRSGRVTQNEVRRLLSEIRDVRAYHGPLSLPHSLPPMARTVDRSVGSSWYTAAGDGGSRAPVAVGRRGRNDGLRAARRRARHDADPAGVHSTLA